MPIEDVLGGDLAAQMNEIQSQVTHATAMLEQIGEETKGNAEVVEAHKMALVADALRMATDAAVRATNLCRLIFMVRRHTAN